MSTEQDLLDAIDANPDDDAPRLAHADWLEQHGDGERAAYVRSSLRGGRDYSDYRWTAGLPTVHGMTWECRRGYPEMVCFRSLAAFDKGWRLTAGHRVRHVVFSCLRGGAKLAEKPALASIKSLELSYVDSGVILAILRSPLLGSLRRLIVRPSYPDDLSLLPGLAPLPVLADLRSLHYGFHSDALSEEPIAALLASPHLGQLRELTFEGWLGAGAMRALWRSTCLSRLAVLEILSGHHWSQQTQPGGLQEISEGAATPNLERFRFNYARGEGGAAAGVAAATRWQRLRELNLSSTSARDAGAAVLADAPHLCRLERFDLCACGVSDAGATALAESPHLRSLSHLDLSYNVIGRAGVSALGRSERLGRLRTLCLGGNPAPAALIEAVGRRFREGGPPVEEDATPEPAAPAAEPAPSAPLIGQADEDGLVRAIWADPFDGVPRLVYADWLEEQSKPLHAALLRAPAPDRRELAGRLLFQMKQDSPCSVTPSLTEEGLVSVSIPVRSLRSRAFERDGPAWLRRHHVAEILPDGTPSDWAGLFAAGWLAHARGLSFARRGFDALATLVASPHVAGLASLILPSHDFSLDAFDALFGASGPRGLCRLSRRGYYLPAPSVRALCEAPFAPHLRHLALAYVPAGGLSLLLGAPALAGLLTLAVGLQGDGEAKLLADATGLGSLRNLDLSEGWFDDVGLDALAGSPLLSRLRRLQLSRVRRHSIPALERLARAVRATPRCRLVLTGEIEPDKREALVAILGDRLLEG